VAVVLLVAISVIAAVAANYFIGGLATKQKTTSQPAPISAVLINPEKATLAVANLGSTSINVSNGLQTDRSGITCNFTTASIEASSQALCTLTSTLAKTVNGSVTVFGQRWGSASVMFPVGIYKLNITNARLVGYWELEEGGGRLASDSGTYNNTGLFPTSASLDPEWINNGVFGKGLYFNGTWNKHVNVTRPPTFSQFTFEAWANVSGVNTTSETCGANYSGLATNVNGRDNGNRLLIRDDGAIIVQIDTTLGQASATSAAGLFTFDRWNHFAYGYNGSGVTAYLNGTLVAQTITSGSLLSGSAPLRIGWGGGDSAPDCFWWNGTIDEPRLWNISLTPTQIRENYESGR
jgi:hypothetical protein